MLVECENCHKRYSLEEEKIPAGGGKFRCRQCEAVILVEPPSAPAGGEAEGSPQTARTPGKRILVADDTLFFRTMVEDLLTEAGYEVITSADGEETLARIRAELPGLDLVVLDMLMPKLDGFQVIRQLKDEGLDRDLPILALTGVFKSDEDREYMKELGIAGYVDKSTPPEMILDRVRMALKEMDDGW